MKKNITINLYGTLYAIDEDAYTLLNRYLESMKSYFRNKEGGEEIADDIEHRVAELLWEQKESGCEAVSISMVKDIIAKIGNPQDIADEGAENASGEKASADSGSSFGKRANEFAEDAARATGNVFSRISDRIRGRRLYRNPNDKVIGGVCSGLAEFFMSGDPLWWRLGFVLMTLITFGSNFAIWHYSVNMMVPALYLILLIIIPVASTPADRLRMKGQEVSPENLKEQVISESEATETKYYAAEKLGKSRSGGCLRVVFFAVMFILLLPLFGTFWGLVAGLVGLIFTLFGASSTIVSTFGNEWFFEMVSSCGVFLWIGLISGLFVVGIPIYAIVHAVNPDAEKMPMGRVMLLVTLWISAAALVVVSFIFGAIRYQEIF